MMWQNSTGLKNPFNPKKIKIHKKTSVIQQLKKDSMFGNNSEKTYLE